MIVIYEEAGAYSDHSIIIRGTATNKALAPAACRYFAARAADLARVKWREFRDGDDDHGYKRVPGGSCIVFITRQYADSEDNNDAGEASRYDILVTWEEVEHLDLPEGR